MRWLLRAPIGLFQAGFGRLFGRRLLMLESIGHRTGLPRHTVLEVVHHEREGDTYYVAAGFGPSSHWYRNVQRHPEVQISVGGRRRPAYARLVENARAGAILAGYATRHPHIAKALMRWLGFEVDGSDADYRAVAESLGLKMVAFAPRSGRRSARAV